MDNNEEIKKKTEELTNQIKKTKEELKDLRKSCKHSEYIIKDINFGKGMLKLMKVCKFCNETIGYPSSQDLKDNGYSK